MIQDELTKVAEEADDEEGEEDDENGEEEEKDKAGVSGGGEKVKA